MPKAIKPIRPGEYLPADVIARLQNAIAEVVVGGRGINVSRQGNRIVIERVGNQIIPMSGRANSIRRWKVSNATARAALIDHSYPDILTNGRYPMEGDICVQTDNHHHYMARDTGSALVWEGLSHWEAAST